MNKAIAHLAQAHIHEDGYDSDADEDKPQPNQYLRITIGEHGAHEYLAQIDDYINPIRRAQRERYTHVDDRIEPNCYRVFVKYIVKAPNRDARYGQGLILNVKDWTFTST